MKTLLTAPDIDYLLTQQDKLDKDIQGKKGIIDLEWGVHYHPKHLKALRIESAEFVNATHDVWKYWKDKAVDRDDVIDEAVDVIHFCCLLFNKLQLSPSRVMQDIKSTVDACVEVMDLTLGDITPKEVELLQDQLLDSKSPSTSIASVLIILDFYDFTARDIINQYNVKNAVNFERLESGY